MEILLPNRLKEASKPKGQFITFEGGEGVGKTTQIDLLKSYLLSKDYNVISTREPGGTTEGEIVRKSLVSGVKDTWDPFSEALIFNALRRQHINKVIIPSLNENKIVICDRFIDSTIVYQGFVGSIEKSILKKLHKNFCYNLYPDITFFIELNPELGLIRSKNRINDKNENRFESFGLDYHKKVFIGFNQLWKKNTKRIIKIDGNQKIEKISKDITYSLSLLMGNNV